VTWPRDRRFTLGSRAVHGAGRMLHDDLPVDVLMRPIVVGVDGSPESVRAACFGASIAERAGTTCLLVHAVPPYWADLPPTVVPDTALLNQQATDQARTLIRQGLEDAVPRPVLEQMEVHVGRPTVVLDAVARRVEAEAVVMGGKHHRALARLGGSSITHLVRSGNVPVLATDGALPDIERVLACVDLSPAASLTLATAERWASAFAARLRVLHAVEPMPVVPGVTLAVAEDEIYRSASRVVDLEIAPRVRYPRAEIVVRRGRATAAIVTEATQWGASLIVLGSHGKGWVDRLMLGSTSERLLQIIPAPTLIIPAACAVADPLGLDLALSAAQPDAPAVDAPRRSS
jgi:nucleotide-binding universal stress UspA family protein